MKEPLFLKTPVVVVAFQVLVSLSGITLLFIIQFSNFLLFHYIVETLSIIVGLLIFNVVWTGRDLIDSKPVIFLGIAYLFVAIMDSSHLISYKGMEVLNIDTSNYATQLWIIARYIEAISILLVSIGIRKIYAKLTFLVYLIVTSLILLGIFRWQIFPVCYDEGTGLGHILKIISYLLIYKAIFIEGIQNPQQFLFRRLNSRQKETMSKLRKSETLYQTLLESLPQSIFFIDRDSKYISCNNSFTQWVQLEKSEIIGRDVYDIFPEIEADRYWEEDLAIMDKGEIEEFEDTITIKNKEVSVQIVKVPVRENDGSVIGLLGIFWDITERKKTETELENYRNHLEDLVVKRTLSLSNTNKLLEEEISERKQMKENVIRARNEAESASRAKSEFIAHMSHDFRTPLNVILGNTQLFLRDPEIMDQYSSSVVRIHKSSLHLLSMVNDILDLINIE
ncbi:MAG: PAS domain-containing protein, partial [Spirochaetales bacterium]|nr:PAS domain-containing protein [Spirochaetales bacterium]